MATPATVPEYIAAQDAKLRPLVRAIRAFVRKHEPRLGEAICRGLPHFEGKGHVAYVAAHTDHVNLGFHNGALLKDPDGLLEGTGKGLRHVKLRSKEDLTPALRKLLRAAVAFDAAG